MPGAAKRPFGGIWNKGSRSGLGMFADGGEMHAECAAPNGVKAFLSYFLCLTKSREKVAARTCKKLPVASFCASETAETGRIANGREQGDHVSRSRLRPATSIQSSDGNNLREASDGTRRTRLFARNGGEKALNRCDAPVLQRKELERTTKE